MADLIRSVGNQFPNDILDVCFVLGVLQEQGFSTLSKSITLT
jgi:hypothetical protein